jgi:hypothetical protein
MITPDEVLGHLYQCLPLLTDRFTEQTAVLSGSIDAELLTLTVADGSAFTVGRSYPVSDIVMINPVVSIVGSASTGYTLTTQNAHSLTVPRMPQDQRTFDLDAEWMDSPITGVPDRTTIFTRNGEPSAPPASNLLERTNGGYFELIAKAGNALTFALPEGFYYPCTCTVSHLSARLNVAIVPDATRAGQVYTQNPSSKLWAFIIMGDRDSIPSDDQQAGVTANGKRNIDNLLVSTLFSILVIWPRESAQESARAQINEAYGSAYLALNSALFGSKLGGSVYRVSPVGNGLAQLSNTAHYAHAYEYQALETIDVLTDGLRPELLSFDAPVRFVDGDLLIDCGETTPQSIKFDIEGA